MDNEFESIGTGDAPDREADLRGAAFALLSWVAARRATWGGEASRTVPAPARPPARAKPRLVVAPPPPAQIIPEPEPTIAREPEPTFAPEPEPTFTPEPEPPFASEPEPVIATPEPPVVALPPAASLVADDEEPLPEHEPIVGVTAFGYAPARAAVRPEPVVAPKAPPVAEPPRPTAARRAADATASIAPAIGRWAVRLGAVAAVVAGIVYGVSVLRPYWAKVTAPPPTTGTAVIESIPPGSEVFVDGNSVGTTPMTTQLAVGKHTVEFHNRKTTRTVGITIAGGKSTTASLDWNKKPMGRLAVTSNPAGAKVTVDGHERGVTPLTLDDIVVGQHAVVVASDQGTVRRTVKIEDSETTQLDETIYPGWVKVSSSIELQISEGGRQMHLNDQDQVMLPAGSHDLRFDNATFAFHEVRRVEVSPGGVTPLSVIPSPSHLSVTASEPAQVSVDGEAVGSTPLVDAPIQIGVRDVRVTSSAGERRYSLTVTTAPVHLDVDFSKPQP